MEDEAFLPWGPGFFVGSVGVGKGEEKKGVKAVFVPHEFGELLDDFGVVDVFLGGEAPECQVVIHQEHDKGTAASGDLKAFAKTGCQYSRAVDVFPDVFGASGVVKN